MLCAKVPKLVFVISRTDFTWSYILTTIYRYIFIIIIVYINSKYIIVVY